MAAKRKIIRKLELKKTVTLIPAAAAVMSTLTVCFTLFCGSSDDPRSVSMAGASHSGAIFFNLSLVLYLPLWGLVLLIYHSETWVLGETDFDIYEYMPKFTRWFGLSRKRLKHLRKWHGCIAIANVAGYAMLVALPVDEFSTEHDIAAGIYFISLWLHLAIAVFFPVRHSKSDLNAIQLIRVFLLFGSTITGIGLFIGMLSENHEFESFELGGSGFAAIYIFSFAVEFRETFNSVSILVARYLSKQEHSKHNIAAFKPPFEDVLLQARPKPLGGRLKF
mgnify:CR=1 FL=1